MSALQVVGGLMVGLVLASAVAATTYAMGWRASVALWLISLTATSVLVIGVILLEGRPA